jgi:hypothetical protein
MHVDQHRDSVEYYQEELFNVAFSEAHQGDITRLEVYLLSDKPLTAQDRKALAGMLRLWREYLDEYRPVWDGKHGKPRKPRKAGTPHSKLDRWRMINFIVADILRGMAADWKNKNNRKTIPEKNLKTLLDKIIEEKSKSPTSAKRNWRDKNPLNARRILAIYRQSRRRQAGG